MCDLYKKLEDTEIDLITGASMMEPDIRIKTNELGFCRNHFDIMLTFGKRLPVALTIQSHLDSIRKDILPGGLFSKDDASKPVKRIEKLCNDCYVCQRIERHFSAMLETACILFERKAGETGFQARNISAFPLFKTAYRFQNINSKSIIPAGKVGGGGKVYQFLYDDVSYSVKI